MNQILDNLSYPVMIIEMLIVSGVVSAIVLLAQYGLLNFFKPIISIDNANIFLVLEWGLIFMGAMITHDLMNALARSYKKQ